MIEIETTHRNYPKCPRNVIVYYTPTREMFNPRSKLSLCIIRFLFKSKESTIRINVFLKNIVFSQKEGVFKLSFIQFHLNEGYTFRV